MSIIYDPLPPYSGPAPPPYYPYTLPHPPMHPPPSQPHNHHDFTPYDTPSNQPDTHITYIAPDAVYGASPPRYSEQEVPAIYTGNRYRSAGMRTHGSAVNYEAPHSGCDYSRQLPDGPSEWCYRGRMMSNYAPTTVSDLGNAHHPIRYVNKYQENRMQQRKNPAEWHHHHMPYQHSPNMYPPQELPHPSSPPEVPSYQSSHRRRFLYAQPRTAYISDPYEPRQPVNNRVPVNRMRANRYRLHSTQETSTMERSTTYKQHDTGAAHSGGTPRQWWRKQAYPPYTSLENPNRINYITCESESEARHRKAKAKRARPYQTMGQLRIPLQEPQGRVRPAHSTPTTKEILVNLNPQYEPKKQITHQIASERTDVDDIHERHNYASISKHDDSTEETICVDDDDITPVTSDSSATVQEPGVQDSPMSDIPPSSFMEHVLIKSEPTPSPNPTKGVAIQITHQRTITSGPPKAVGQQSVPTSMLQEVVDRQQQSVPTSMLQEVVGKQQQSVPTSMLQEVMGKQQQSVPINNKLEDCTEARNIRTSSMQMNKQNVFPELLCINLEKVLTTASHPPDDTFIYGMRSTQLKNTSIKRPQSAPPTAHPLNKYSDNSNKFLSDDDGEQRDSKSLLLKSPTNLLDPKHETKEDVKLSMQHCQIHGILNYTSDSDNFENEIKLSTSDMETTFHNPLPRTCLLTPTSSPSIMTSGADSVIERQSMFQK